MCTARHFISAALAVVLTMTMIGASRSVSAQERPYRISQQQEVDQLLRRIETRSTQFRQSLYAALNQSRIDGTRQGDNINEFVRNFETATATLRDRFRQRRDVGSDVSEVLAKAALIDRFMGRQRLASNAEQDWSALRSDLDGLARYYNVAWSWDAGTGERPYRISQEQQVDQLLRRIETRSTQFRQSLYAALNQSRIDGTRQEDNINEFVRNFETATASLRDRFRQRRDVASDVSEVLAQAAFIDRFMGRHRLASNAEQDWSALRSDLDGLARYYNVAWSWDAGTGERPYRISQEQQVDQLLRRIETRSTQFRQSLYAALNQSRIDGTRQEDNINEFVRNFETATASLRDRFRQRRDVASDVSEVLAQAAFIDRFMGRHRLASNAEQDWSALRSDLDGLARYYNVAWSWDAGTGERPYRISQEQQVDQLLRRIETRSTQFRQSLYAALNQSRIDGTRQEDNINEFVRNFETATASLRDRFRQRRDVASDVSEVLAQAAFIDRFMGRHRLASNAEQDWSALRSDLDGLARYYNVAWSWDAGTGERGDAGQGRRWDAGTGRAPGSSRLSGTYRLDPTRSDRVGRAAKIATRGLSPEEQQRVRDMLSRRLEAPEMLAIERNGRNVTIASSRAPQVTVEADGRDRIEQTPRGRS